MGLVGQEGDKFEAVLAHRSALHVYLLLICNGVYSVVKEEHRAGSEGWATRCARMSQAVMRGQYAVPESAASASSTGARLAIIRRQTETGLVEFKERYDRALSTEGQAKRKERHEGRM